MVHILEEFKNFLDTSPTSWHAAYQIGNRLAMQDFIPLNENEKWQIEPGQKYFIIRGGSVCAFSLPSSTPQRGVILASHTDSPSLKIKPRPEIRIENMLALGVEVYGHPLLTSWLNRDLGIAGRIVVTDASGNIEEKLVVIDDSPLIIPQLAIHFDREVNEKGLTLNKQEHLCPLLGLDENQHSIEDLLKRHVSFHSLLSSDLFLFPLERSRFLGLENELIASYRIDNLASAHACLTALACAHRPQKNTIQMAVFWDHEEVGSKSLEGAESPFFSEILKRIFHGLKLDKEDLFIFKRQSLCLSVDMAHAVHPNHLKALDPNHGPKLGKGPVIKYNAAQRYASNAFSAAQVIRLCQKLNLNVQSFVNRSDIPSGSTVGPLFAHHDGIATVDIGCPQLSMHSIREVMACQDYFDICRLLTHVLQEE
ncbi:MAG TPA: M18 family aminopeptidase [Rhabdochlamydiaceae bacterium]|nr:M18 family aminopeptidase [Rhabdochlamydiaceae bacterium]